jgi:hypothetical protein
MKRPSKQRPFSRIGVDLTGASRWPRVEWVKQKSEACALQRRVR